MHKHTIQLMFSWGFADGMRLWAYSPKNRGFMSGLQNGLTATNDVFDTPVVQMPQKGHLGLELDVKALRSDVRKAKAKFTQQTPTAAG